MDGCARWSVKRAMSERVRCSVRASIDLFYFRENPANNLASTANGANEVCSVYRSVPPAARHSFAHTLSAAT
jgi:hypothetical protein